MLAMRYASHAMAEPPSIPSAFLRIPGVELTCESLTSSGLALTAAPDGHVTLAAERMVVQGVQVVTDHVRMDIAQVALDDVRAEVMPIAGAPALTRFAARHLVVDRLQAGIARGAIAGDGAPSPVQLDALASLDGLVHAFVTDALWFVDADVSVPIRQGSIDFNKVEIEHIGPNSTLGVSPAGIHVEGPAGQRRVPVVAFGPVPPPGVAFETRGRFPFARGDRGRIDLLPFLQAFLAAPPGQPPAQPADPNLVAALDRTRIRGEVRIGDGTLARGGQRVELAGREAGKNRCSLDSPALGQRLVIGVPEFAAGAAILALPGLEVRTATLEAAVEAHLLGREAPPDGPRVVLSIAQATLHDVSLAPAA